MIDIFKKMLFFFDSYDKKSLFVLLILFLFTGIIELLGIASIVPFVGLLTDPNYFSDNKYFIYFREFLDINNDELIFVSGFFIIAVFIISNILNAYVLWKTIRYTAIQSHKISCSVLNKYLSQTYKYFVNADIASLTKNILEESISLAESIFLPTLQIISRVIVLILISTLLISVNYQAFFFSLAIIFLIYFLIFRRIKNILKKFGHERLSANDKRFKSINDCLSSIKDVKFYSAEKYYSTTFSNSQKDFLNLTAKSTLLATMPRYLIEIFAFGGFFSIILYIIYINTQITPYLPTIALFVLAAYRILPSLQQIFAFSSSIKFHYPALELIYNVLKLPETSDIKIGTMSDTDKDLIFDDISFSYDGNKSILKNISFSIERSSINAIIGSTGIGKTTLIDLLLGFFQPNSGQIKINKNIFNLNSGIKKIGYVPQNVSFIDDTLAKNIAFGLNNKDIDYDYLNEVIKCVHLDTLVNSLIDGCHTRIGEKGVKLSGGQLQRLGIARALYLKPSVLVLDEATSSLDIKTEEEVIKSLRRYKNNITIIFITHRISALKLCDNILHLTGDQITKIDLENDKNNIESIVDNLIYNKS